MKWYQIRIRVVLLSVIIGYFLTNPLTLLFDYDKEMALNLDPPCVIVYKEDIPDALLSYSKGMLVYIRPADRHDIPSLKHEFVHIKQFWSTLGLMPILYLNSDRFRLLFELEAFREQLKYEPDREAARREAAYLLAYQYKLEKLVDYQIAYCLLGDK